MLLDRTLLYHKVYHKLYRICLYTVLPYSVMLCCNRNTVMSYTVTSYHNHYVNVGSGFPICAGRYFINDYYSVPYTFLRPFTCYWCFNFLRCFHCLRCFSCLSCFTCWRVFLFICLWCFTYLRCKETSQIYFD